MIVDDGLRNEACNTLHRLRWMVLGAIVHSILVRPSAEDIHCLLEHAPPGHKAFAFVLPALMLKKEPGASGDVLWVIDSSHHLTHRPLEARRESLRCHQEALAGKDAAIAEAIARFRHLPERETVLLCGRRLVLGYGCSMACVEHEHKRKDS